MTHHARSIADRVLLEEAQAYFESNSTFPYELERSHASLQCKQERLSKEDDLMARASALFPEEDVLKLITALSENPIELPNENVESIISERIKDWLPALSEQGQCNMEHYAKILLAEILLHRQALLAAKAILAIRMLQRTTFYHIVSIKGGSLGKELRAERVNEIIQDAGHAAISLVPVVGNFYEPVRILFRLALALRKEEEDLTKQANDSKRTLNFLREYVLTLGEWNKCWRQSGVAFAHAMGILYGEETLPTTADVE